jgi:hypothetical protein
MSRARIRFRLVLPIVFGFLALVLMAWDYENNRMIGLMGMGWDTGPPFWPYQAIYLLLFSINAPAFILSIPILKLLRLQTLSLQYGVWYPAIVICWWWAGTRIDFGILGRRHFRHEKPVACVLIMAAVFFLYIAAHVTLGEIRWWTEYGRDPSAARVATVLRTVGPVSWCLIFACGCALAAVRLLRRKIVSATEDSRGYWKAAIVAATCVVYALGIHRVDKALNPPFNYDECEVDRLYGLGCVHGTVVDESGKPISKIEVDLIPIHKTGDARWYGTRYERTDERGRSNINRVDAGDYLVGVNAFSAYGAPDAERPFATAYYPAAGKESDALSVTVARSSPLYLPSLRLRKLDLATIKINVLWSDGTRPERSNVYFKNVFYPRDGVIASQIDNGEGAFTLPKGFEYDAAASVDCDAGKTIESRESRPDQRIKVADGFTPSEMTLVIPGPRCFLWVNHDGALSKFLRW